MARTRAEAKRQATPRRAPQRPSNESVVSSSSVGSSASAEIPVQNNVVEDWHTSALRLAENECFKHDARAIEKVIFGILDNIDPVLKISQNACDCLVESSQNVIQQLFEDSAVMMRYSERKTLQVKDMQVLSDLHLYKRQSAKENQPDQQND